MKHRVLVMLFLTLCAGAVSQASAQDLSNFSAADCAGIQLPSETDTSAPIAHAKWCGSGGATSSLDNQVPNHHETCGYFRLWYGWGALSQNILFDLAVMDAKDGSFNLAATRIAACQCHNPPFMHLVQDRSREVVCWLRTQ